MLRTVLVSLKFISHKIINSLVFVKEEDQRFNKFTQKLILSNNGLPFE